MTVLLTRRAALSLIALAPVAARAAVSAGPTKSALHAADGRAIPLSRWHARDRHVGTIAFSHGAASAPWKYPAMMDRWTAAGFDVFAPLHVDSIEHPHRADYKGLAGWAARIEDMRAVSRHIGHEYIAVGHSFGGLGALVLGGASAVIPAGVTGPLRDPRATRVVAFSPPQPIPSLIDAAGYATLATPALIETGTHDLPPGMEAADSWHAHLSAYDSASAGNHRYALVLDDADHYFGGLICDFSKPGPPQTDALAQAITMSLLFMTASVQREPFDFARLDVRLTDVGPTRLWSK